MRLLRTGARLFGETLAVIILATAVGALAQGPQTSIGGALLPAINYVMAGSWTFRNASPIVINPAGNTNGTTITTNANATARTMTLPDATDTFVGQATTDTLTNKTLTAPVLGGTVTGTYTLGGTPTVASPIVTGFVDIGAAMGSAGSDRVKLYAVDSVADATTTPIFTVTVPNGIHAAVIPIVLMTGLGTGGAVGDWECSGTAYGQIVIERFTGAATVATATALSNTGSACSAGATTITTAYAVSSMTGAVSATQTFTVNATITKGGGSSANHHIRAQVDALNANATGITIS